MNILNSASKIAFLALVLTSCGAFLLKLLEAKDFMVIVMAAASYYFARKTDDPSQPLGGK